MPRPGFGPYHRDPLNLSIGVPDPVMYAAAREHCDCGAPPECFHDERCAVFGVWGDTVRATGIEAMALAGFPTFPREVNNWRMQGFGGYQWQCSWHGILGDINGPIHMVTCAGKSLLDLRDMRLRYTAP